jgi:hypothetical protein
MIVETAAVLPFEIGCWCGAVCIELRGEPLAQFYCHCGDCQMVHGAAYVAVTLFPADSVRVVRGDLVESVYKTMPRQRCARCATQVLGKVNGQPIVGVKGNLLPKGVFKPAFHIHCGNAVLPVADALPHYAGVPAQFGGTDECSAW